MKKEVFIAILFGLIVGLMITYGVYRVRTAMNSPEDSQLTEVATTSAGLEAASTVVTILNPEEGAVLTERDTTITGSTIPNAHVVLFVNDTDYISSSDSTGSFAFTVTLAEGANVLTVHVVDAEGATNSAERVVVVTDIYAQSSESAATPSAAVEETEN